MAVSARGSLATFKPARHSSRQGCIRQREGNGLSACSGDMLLEALVACAGVTLNAVADGDRRRYSKRRGQSRRRSRLSRHLGGRARIRAESDSSASAFILISETDASEDELSTLIRLTERYCVVYQTLRHTAGNDCVPSCIIRGLKALQTLTGRTLSLDRQNAEIDMPVYMDIHEIHGRYRGSRWRRRTALDVETQQKYGVEYHKYWFNESCGKIFCLCSAPSPEAAAWVHREAHGLVAAKIIEVAPEIAEGFLGGCGVNNAGAALVPGGVGKPARPGNPDRPVHRYRRLDRAHATPRGRSCHWLFLEGRTTRSSEMPLGAFGGREIKHTGDGIMACFVSAVAAARCATRIQAALAQHERENTDVPVKVRIGAAAGEPVENHMDLFGATVQLAARLCSHAQPKQSLVSNVVAELCIGKGLTFQDLGEVSLKDFDRPIRVHAIQQPGEVAPARITDMRRICSARRRRAPGSCARPWPRRRRRGPARGRERLPASRRPAAPLLCFGNGDADGVALARRPRPGRAFAISIAFSRTGGGRRCIAAGKYSEFQGMRRLVGAPQSARGLAARGAGLPCRRLQAPGFWTERCRPV